MDNAGVQEVRRFNRAVTQRIGVLNDEYLARSRPLGASRLLWEIGPDGSDVRSLRARLDLDSGYVSRLLRSLEDDRLVKVVPDASDRRVRIAHLTKAGRAELELLGRLSDDLAWSLLEPLTADQRSRLIEAMGTVERLLTAGMVELEIEDPTTRDAHFCIRAYFAELDSRFETGFDPQQSISASAAELTEPAGLFLIARLHDEPVGCGALKMHGSRTGRDQAHVDRRRGSRDSDWRAELWRTWSVTHGSAASAPSGSRPTDHSTRPSGCTNRRAIARSSALATSPTPTTGSKRSFLHEVTHQLRARPKFPACDTRC